jgi:O-antigen ligase
MGRASSPAEWFPGTGILLILTIVTFAFSKATVDPFHALRWGLLSLAGIVAGCGLLWRRPDTAKEEKDGMGKVGIFPSRAPRFAAIALAAGYAFFSAASWIPAINKAEAGWQIAQVFAWCAWFAAILSAGSWSRGSLSRSFWRTIRRGAVACALLGSAIAIGQYWGIWNPLRDSGQEPSGLHGNRNLHASLQFLLAPWMLWALWEEKRMHRFLAAAAWLGFAYTLAITQCRAVWLGSLAAGVACISLFPFSPLSITRADLTTVLRRRFPLPGFLALSLFASFLFHDIKKPAFDARTGSLTRAASILDPAYDSNAQRLALWRKTASLIAAHPFTGVGAGNWKIALPSTGMAGLLWPDMSVTEVRPYNDWLWTFSETGLAGGLCWLGIWAAALLAGFRAVRASGRWDSALPALLLTSGLLGFGVVSCLDFPKERPEHMAWYAAGLAALLCMGGRTIPGMDAAPAPVRRARRHFVERWALVPGIALAGAALAFSWVRWHDEALVKEIFAAHANRDWPAVIATAARTHTGVCSLNPAASPLAWHEGIARYELGDRPGAEQAFLRSLAAHPYHILTLHNLAVCRLNDGDTVAALRYLRGSLELSPGFAAAALAASRLSLYQGSYGPARKALEGVAPGDRGPEWHSLAGQITLHERNLP